MPNYPPDAQWFRALGSCRCGCGKPATGVLMGKRNDDRGPYTEKCAEKAIAAAKESAARQENTLYEALQAVSDMLLGRPDMVATLQPMMGPAEHAIFDAAAAALRKARGEP